MSSGMKPVLKSSFDHFDRSIFPPFDARPREYLNLQLISSQMFRLHFVINYGKISEHLWTPHCLNSERTHVASCAHNTNVMGNS